MDIHQSSMVVDGIEIDLNVRIVQELIAMKIDKKTIFISEENGNTKISFEWKYPGTQETKIYNITYIQEDIKTIGQQKFEKQNPFLDRLLKEGIDLYYQRAPSTIAKFYEQFMGRIGSSLKPGGFAITDDFMELVLNNPTQYLESEGSMFGPPIYYYMMRW